jgi:hypothetical protein
MSNKVINIGRSNDNNIVISNDKVSSHHCSIRQVSPTEIVIEDLDSSNGTYINEKRIKQSLIKATDKLILAGQDIDVSLVLSLFDEKQIPISLSYQQLIKQYEEKQKQEKIIEEFIKLQHIYQKYQKDKKKIIHGNTLKSTGLRAGLSLIPFVGAALGALSGNVTGNVQEKLMELSEKFKVDYICPSCFKFLGDEPWENMRKRGTCFYCKVKWIKD